MFILKENEVINKFRAHKLSNYSYFYRLCRKLNDYSKTYINRRATHAFFGRPIDNLLNKLRVNKL